MTWLEAVILALIEGITEFLPISSTGHMIIGSTVMGIAHHDFTKIFTVCIQFGAILSVLTLYWKRFLQSFSFYLKLLTAFIPAAVFGLLFSDLIDQMLENVIVVAVMLILGGIVFLFVDKWFTTAPKKEEANYKNALVIGLFQVLAMIPGVSRSAATIIGGLNQNLTRKAAAEFSFFLAVPTMFAATGYKLLQYFKDGNSFTNEEIGILALGNIVAYLVAMLAIKTFIGYLSRHGFKLFGYYRIIIGSVLLILYFTTGLTI